MPIIEEEIWQKQKNNGLLLIGIDRDEPLETVIAFGEKMKITYPLALDPGAEIFSLFAHKKSGVTRNVIIDKDGNIAFLTRLFNKEEFNEMKSVINQLLSS
jgi:peroxiredoxin